VAKKKKSNSDPTLDLESDLKKVKNTLVKKSKKDSVVTVGSVRG